MYLKTMFFFFHLLAGLSTSEHITGLSVSATTVEISTDTAMVIVNCL